MTEFIEIQRFEIKKETKIPNKLEITSTELILGKEEMNRIYRNGNKLEKAWINGLREMKIEKNGGERKVLEKRYYCGLT